MTEIHKCPTCNQTVWETCAVSNCMRVPEFEGFIPNFDPFTGTKTGLAVRRKLCKEHAEFFVEHYGLRWEDEHEEDL